ncbi:DUF2797 domain-containing protein [Streptomyces omiyaensis]|uniref:DUF2797 domain-containing protein n=1 Tax=Streptomyces omiyaensis TaxID=68247 RepID=A0ABW7BQQ0_9ACTN|nr:DUF2797 domain-containing protein [Streptomyces omiyaensis]GGY72417.1 hypothetical protein GCM10010363_62300 [Streptomyces omiyaensis]
MAGVVWRSGGVGWSGGSAGLRWWGGRVSPVVYGRPLAFRAVGGRACAGARGNACPVGAAVPGRSTGGLCADCARLDRAHSVAADTFADDPRPYRVYLAWFGPGTVKAGITGEHRGDTRLREQGAVAFCWLGRGPLMGARRTEEVLRQALGVPDRVAYERKRALRVGPPDAGARAAELAELHARALGVGGWGETLEALPFTAHDHGELFGLGALPPLDGTVAELVEGGVVTGRVLAAAGPDLHLGVPDGRHLVLDGRLLGGWGLARAGEGEPWSVPVGGAPEARTEQDGLF